MSSAATQRPAAGRERPAADLDHVVRHLLGISRDFEPRLLRALQARGHPGLRPSFARLLFLVWDEPRPLNLIADELGVTPQAAGHTARLVEQVGYVSLETNPADRRSKLVVVTDRGRAVDDERGAAAIRACEDHYAGLIGADASHQLGSVVVTLWERMNPGRTAHLRTLFGVLPLLALKLRSDLHAVLTSHGHPGLKASHHEVVTLLSGSGARASEIARSQGISRQAVGQTLRELESLGYVRRRPDETDRRGVVFSLSEYGSELVADTVGVLHDLRARMAVLLGEALMRQLEDGARRLDLALRLDAAVSKGHSKPQAAQAPGEPSGAERDEPYVVRLAVRLRESLSPSDVAFLAALLTAPQESDPQAVTQEP